MTQQPEALRLAHAILTNKWPQVSPIWEASQELRRLHEVNAELLEVLEKLARLGNGERYGNSEGNVIARAAVIKGRNQT